MSKVAVKKMSVEVVWYTSLDGNDKDGYSVNNQSRNTHSVEMPDFTESSIVKMLKQESYIKETARSNSFTWEWLDDCECVLTYKGRPLCEVCWVQNEEDVEDNDGKPNICKAIENAEVQHDGDFTELYEDILKQVGDVKIGDYDKDIVIFTKTKPNNKNRCLSPRQFRKLAFDITRNHKKTRVALKIIKKMEKLK